MAKSLMKKVKKGGKKAFQKAEAKVEKVEKVEKAASSAASSARSHIESLSKQRRDAAVMWGMIQNGNHSTEQIIKMCEEKGFSQLLSEIS